jgi:hypothetical protein
LNLAFAGLICFFFHISSNAVLLCYGHYFLEIISFNFLYHFCNIFILFLKMQWMYMIPIVFVIMNAMAQATNAATEDQNPGAQPSQRAPAVRKR